MLNKGLIIAILLILSSINIVTSTPDNIIEPLFPIDIKNTILFVGGNGPGNYSRIQDAIDNSTFGDTVFVFSGTYYENVMIDKTIDLVGEDKNKTVIDSGGKDDPVRITADSVTLKGFTLQQSGGISHAGVQIQSEHNLIMGNIIERNNGYGIHLDRRGYNYITNNIIAKNGNDGIFITDFSGKNDITQNIIEYNEIGICMVDSFNSGGTTIHENIITHNNVGIHFGDSDRNVISGNVIKDNRYIGLSMSWAENNIISGNTIENHNEWGVEAGLSHNNSFLNNNFINRKGRNLLMARCSNVKFDGNYWNWRLFLPSSSPLPALIIVFKLLSKKPPYDYPIPFFNIDWHPATEPYDI